MAPFYYVYFRSQDAPFYYYAGYLDGPVKGSEFRKIKSEFDGMSRTFTLIHWMMTGIVPEGVHVRPYVELLKVLDYWKKNKKILYDDLKTDPL